MLSLTRAPAPAPLGKQNETHTHTHSFILRPGCNVHSTYFRNVKIFNVNNNNISVHPMHIVRVLPGFYGLCSFDGVPHIMMPGRHFINDPLFQYRGLIPVTSPCVVLHATAVFVFSYLAAAAAAGGRNTKIRSPPY
jgi:hypothetical protein